MASVGRWTNLMSGLTTMVFQVELLTREVTVHLLPELQHFRMFRVSSIAGVNILAVVVGAEAGGQKAGLIKQVPELRLDVAAEHIADC